MKVTNHTGTLILDDDETPSIDDMNYIISSVTSDDDEGAQFQRLCAASCEFPAGLTNAQFLDACQKWVADDAKGGK